MTWIDDGGVRQLADVAQTLDNHEHGASAEVGSSDGIAKQGVARKCYILFLTIEEHAAS